MDVGFGWVEKELPGFGVYLFSGERFKFIMVITFLFVHILWFNFILG